MPTGFDERVWERRQLKSKRFEFDTNEVKCSGTGGNVCVCVCLVMIDLREGKKKKKSIEKKNKRVTGME